MSKATRQRIVVVAEGWLRTPYHHRARIKGVGVDCAQLLIGVYAEVGLIEPFDTGHYPSDWMLHRDDERFLTLVQSYAKREVESPKPGDVAVFRYGRCYSHGAIVVMWPRVIHAFRNDRCVSYGDASLGELADRPVRFFSLLGRGR